MRRRAVMWIPLVVVTGVTGSCFYPVDPVAERDVTPPDSDADPGSGGAIASGGAPPTQGTCAENHLCLSVIGLRLMEPDEGLCSGKPRDIYRCGAQTCNCKEVKKSDGKCVMSLAVSKLEGCEDADAAGASGCTRLDDVASVRLSNNPKDGVECKPTSAPSTVVAQRFCERLSSFCEGGKVCVPLSGSCILIDGDTCPIAGWTEMTVALSQPSAEACDCTCPRCTGKTALFYDTADCTGDEMPIPSDGACRTLPRTARSFKGATGPDCDGRYVLSGGGIHRKLCCPPT